MPSVEWSLEGEIIVDECSDESAGGLGPGTSDEQSAFSDLVLLVIQICLINSFAVALWSGFFFKDFCKKSFNSELIPDGILGPSSTILYNAAH